MPVHVGGQACEMDQIVALARTHELAIVEDAAHAYPTTVASASVTDGERRSRLIGSIGHATAFSFYATKTIATGEGGMLTTDDDRVAERVRLMRLHGVSKDAWNRNSSPLPSWYYEVLAPGFKYNLTDIASSLGLVQLQRGQELLDRAAIARTLCCGLRRQPALEPPVLRHADRHLRMASLHHAAQSRPTLHRSRPLHARTGYARGIGCSVHFIPLHMQPYWRDLYRLTPSMLPVASREFPRVISLPIYPDMTGAMVDRVIEAVIEIASRYRR